MNEGAAPAPAAMTLDALRAERTRLQHVEDAVSYARRVAQARLDLVRARLADGDRPLSEQLRDVLARQLVSPSGRPPRDTDAPDAQPVAVELEEICSAGGFSRFETLDRAGLENLADALASFEQRVSSERRELFGRIDALSADLVRRYRDGSASVDRLWDEPGDG